jgi:hypothetical protein
MHGDLDRVFGQIKDGNGVVLVSCLGYDTGGGLFALGAGGAERIDSLSTTGLYADSERFCRLLHGPENEGTGGEVLVYDRRGVLNYMRVDSLCGGHDLLRDGPHLVVVSSGTNSILWIDLSGRVVRAWRAPGRGDAWHLNCLAMTNGHLLVSGFGKFGSDRDWVGNADRATGFLTNVSTQEDVLTGLRCPHSPRVVGGAWLVCNSARGEVVQIDPADGSVLRRQALGGWTRGVAVLDDFLLVGVSAHRYVRSTHDRAAVVVLRRETWSVLGLIPLPCREVYDVVLTGIELAEGVRRGFRTNPLRVAEQDQHAMFTECGLSPTRLWASGDPLPGHACRVELEPRLPRRLPIGDPVRLGCLVRNRGTAALVSAPPNPVYLSYKWLDADTRGLIPETEGVRSPLPGSLFPGQTVSCDFVLQPPREPGDYRLLLTLVQEGVAWFDELDSSNACEVTINIVRSGAG